MSQTVTKGSAPSLSISVSGSTNRITTSGYSHDSNGNLTAAPFLTMTYDVENRLAQATHSLNGTEIYGYDAVGLRVWQGTDASSGTLYFYGADGKLLTTADAEPFEVEVYFAGRKVWAHGQPVVGDRLGQTQSKYPYNAAPTYVDDSITGLDYARHRYYSTSIARFTTPDPYRASGGPADPQSWNRYSYVQNDPVNRNDPSGLWWNWLGGFFSGGSEGSICDYYPDAPGCSPYPVVLGRKDLPMPDLSSAPEVVVEVAAPSRILGSDAVRPLLAKPPCAQAVGASSAEAALARWDQTGVEFASWIGPIRLIPTDQGTYRVDVQFGAASQGGDTINVNGSSGFNWADPGNSYGYVVAADMFTITSQAYPVNLLDVMQSTLGLSSLSTADFQAAVLLHEFSHILGREESQIDMRAIFTDCLGIEMRP